MRLLKVALTALAMSISLPIAEACACSCIYRTESEHMEAADAVFEGVVIESRDPVDSSPTGSGDQIEWIFDVEEILKGEVRDPQSIWSARESSTCGFRFEVNKRYRVYAYNFEGQMRTSICSGTRSAERAEPIESSSPSPVPEESPTPQPANSPPEAGTIPTPIALPGAPQPPVSPVPIPTVEVSIPSIEPLTLSASRNSTPAQLPAVGIAMSVGILAAGAATARRWRRPKRN